MQTQPPQGVVAFASNLVGMLGTLAALCSAAWLGVGVCVGCGVGVASQPYLEGSLFAPTRTYLTYLYFEGLASQVCGGVCGVCGWYVCMYVYILYTYIVGVLARGS